MTRRQMLRLTEDEFRERAASSPSGFVEVPLEREIQQEAKESLALHPAVQQVWRVNSGAHVAGEGDARRFIRYHTIPGMSDLWLLLKPRYGMRFAFIEIKRPGEKPSEKQGAFLSAMRERGHVAFVAESGAEAWVRLTEALGA